MIERARANNPTARYEVYDGTRLPHDDHSFDVVFATCVLHHVDPPARPALAREMLRVTRRGGVVALQEHNPLNPLTRRVVARCAFDEGVELIGIREAGALLVDAGSAKVSRRYILFFPWHAEVFRRAERLLGAIPLGAQYMVTGTPR
jgi:SAM-dependent methyltransferase